MTPTTFIVRSVRTDNDTWQGRIGHTQTGEMRMFRSCLEMLRIMDEILESKKPSPKEIGRHAGK